MQFHINHIPEKPDFEIHHGHQVMLTGSCFSENIGALLKDHQFKTVSNPRGLLFNPLSIYQCLDDLVRAKQPDERFILKRGDLFLSYLHHSSLHSTSKGDLVKKINAQDQQAGSFLKEADYLIITFGTAFVYHHRQLDAVVANCHKQAAQLFEKKLLDPEQITGLYLELTDRLKVVNPRLKILFTLSPVKYLKDGLIENNLSKSVLTLSIHQLIRQRPHCFYFPAYELVNDDLRDYRFYKKDLAHPNELAIDYVWQKFSECYFSEAAKNLNRQIHKLNLALSHRKLMQNEDDPKLRDFIDRQKEEIAKQMDQR